MGTFPQVPPFKFLKIGIFNLLDFYIYETDELKGGTWGNGPYTLNPKMDLTLILTVSEME